MVAAAAMLFVGSCQKYNDLPLKLRVDDLESRVSVLEELCKQANTNISSLLTIVSALQNNDCVTSVAPVMKNGETIGYTFTFSKSAPITIYCNENGTGTGAGGNMPVIGVRQDTDGVYYWTLDGDWLTDDSGNKIKAEGRDGADGADGKDGENGADGKPGADGKDGVTPQLKIEDGYWFVSTDNGATWTNLGKATGEDGKDGADSGDSIFQSITQDDDNIYFALKNGETIVLPKKQQLAITFSGGNSLQFDVDETKTVNYTITGGGTNNVVKAEMQNLDNAYSLRTTPTSATKGTIQITAKVPTTNNVIVSVSNGTQTIMAAIAVSIKPSFAGNTITIATPGTLSKLLADYDKTSITELTVIGNLNSSDISTLNSLPNLAVLDMENVNLEKLPSYAFASNKTLTSVKLPRTSTTIGRDAFYGCSSLTSVYITDIAKWCAIEFDANPANPLYYAHNLYLNGELVTKLVIPDSVTTIGKYAFCGCSLTSVTIGNGVTEIGDQAFSSCSGLTSVTIGNGVTSIGGSAFYCCSGLTSVTIGNGVTTIGKEAFYGCSGLKSIYCKAQTPPSVGSSAFANVSTTLPLYVPTGSADAYRTAEEWKRFTNINEMEFE